MIVDERIVTFINSLETENSEILEAVDTKTYVHPGSRDRSRFLCVIDE